MHLEVGFCVFVSAFIIKVVFEICIVFSYFLNLIPLHLLLFFFSKSVYFSVFLNLILLHNFFLRNLDIFSLSEFCTASFLFYYYFEIYIFFSYFLNL